MDDVTKSLNVTLSHTLVDEHCFLHAVALQRNQTQNTMQAYDFLMKAIETENRTNKNQYTNFIDKDSGKLHLLIHKYLHDKIFDHAAGDLFAQITSNAIQKPIRIYSERDSGIWKTIVQLKITQQINKFPLSIHQKECHYGALINEKMHLIVKLPRPDD
ncbi:OTU domain [Trinorchestia longiramus]|nr:OTU domain [Trinorchestia longiramus]